MRYCDSLHRWSQNGQILRQAICIYWIHSGCGSVGAVRCAACVQDRLSNVAIVASQLVDHHRSDAVMVECAGVKMPHAHFFNGKFSRPSAPPQKSKEQGAARPAVTDQQLSILC